MYNALLLDMKGFPLPPADPNHSVGSPITPLTQSSLNMFDPVQYMALWELKGLQPTSSSTAGMYVVQLCFRLSVGGWR